MFRSKEEYKRRYENKVDDIVDAVAKEKIKSFEMSLKYLDMDDRTIREWLSENKDLSVLIRKLKREVEEDIKNEIEEVKRNPNHWKNRVIRYGATTPLNEDEKREVKRAVSYYDGLSDVLFAYWWGKYDKSSDKRVMRNYYETTDYYKDVAFKVGVYRYDFEYNIHFWYWVNRYQTIDEKDFNWEGLNKKDYIFWCLLKHYRIDEVDLMDEKEKEVLYIKALDEFHHAKIAERFKEIRANKRSEEDFIEEEESGYDSRLINSSTGEYYTGHEDYELIDPNDWDKYMGEYMSSYDKKQEEEDEYKEKQDGRGYTEEQKDNLISFVRFHNLIPFDPEIEEVETKIDDTSNQEDVMRYYRYKAYLRYILKEVPKSWKFE